MKTWPVLSTNTYFNVYQIDIQSTTHQFSAINQGGIFKAKRYVKILVKILQWFSHLWKVWLYLWIHQAQDWLFVSCPDIQDGSAVDCTVLNCVSNDISIKMSFEVFTKRMHLQGFTMVEKPHLVDKNYIACKECKHQKFKDTLIERTVNNFFTHSSAKNQ